MRKFIPAILLSICVSCSAEPVKSLLGSYSISMINSGEQSIVEVEYLESTGTQYILLNTYVDGFDGWLLPENNNNYGAVGIWNGGSRADTIKWTSLRDRGWCFNNGNNSGNVITFDMTYKLSRCIIDGTSCFVNGNYYQMGLGWNLYFLNQYFALFGCYHRDGYVSTQSCKIGRCKLYLKGELIYDFIPVRFLNENNNWEGAIYDEVRGTMFRNQGTGEFKIGSDI